MAGGLAGLDAHLAELAKGIESPRAVRAGGLAAKRAAEGVARDVTGGDMKLSGWNRKRGGLSMSVTLAPATGATETAIELGPKGVWTTMEDGRQDRGNRPMALGKIRGKGAKRARKQRDLNIAFGARGALSGATPLRTPYGPRYSVKPSSSTAKHAVTRTKDKAREDATEAAHREVDKILREVWS